MTCDQGLGVGGQLEVLKMYRSIGETFPAEAPNLDVGDALVFTKCTVQSFLISYFCLYNHQVHTCSGSNTLRRPRHAWQIRFFSEPQVQQFITEAMSVIQAFRQCLSFI